MVRPLPAPRGRLKPVEAARIEVVVYVEQLDAAGNGASLPATLDERGIGLATPPCQGIDCQHDLL